MLQAYKNWEDFENLVKNYPNMKYDCTLNGTDWVCCAKCGEVVTYYSWEYEFHNEQRGNKITFDIEKEKQKIERHVCGKSGCVLGGNWPTWEKINV